jgi:hypothetical protein
MHEDALRMRRGTSQILLSLMVPAMGERGP